MNPLAEIEKLLAYSHTIFFSTTLLPSTPKPLGEWWYYGLDHGQHVSFYSQKTLEVIAKKFDLRIIFSRGQLHLFSDQPISPLKAKISLIRYASPLRLLLEKRQPKSLQQKDFTQITGNKLE